MKTLNLNQKIRSALLTLTVALAFVGCSKNSSDGSTVANTGYTYNVSGQCIQNSTGQIVTTTLCQNSTGYSYNGNGQCIQSSTGQIVATQLCQTTSVTGYSYVNGQCIQSSTGQIVTTTLCQTSGTGVSQSCIGMYMMDPRNGSQGICTGTVGASNCTGLTLINLQTGQQIYCQ